MSELKVRIIFDMGNGETKLRKTGQTITFVAGSVGDLEQKLKLANLTLKQSIPGTKEYEAAILGVKAAEENLIRVKKDLASASRGVSRNTANATFTLQAMNYTIRDSPYFFRDFSLGLLAIGNNLNPLIDGFIRMKQEAKAAGVTFRSQLLGILKGTNGLIFFFSVLVSVIQAVTFALAKNKSQAKENKDEYKDLAESVKDYTLSLKQANEELDKTSLKEYKKELNDLELALNEFRHYPNPEAAKGILSDKDLLRFTQYYNAAQRLNEEIAKLEKPAPEVSFVKLAKYVEQIKEWTKSVKGASEEQIKAYVKANDISVPAIDRIIEKLKDESKTLGALSPELAKYNATIKALQDLGSTKTKDLTNERLRAERELAQLHAQSIKDQYQREMALIDLKYKTQLSNYTRLNREGLISARQLHQAEVDLGIEKVKAIIKFQGEYLSQTLSKIKLKGSDLTQDQSDIVEHFKKIFQELGMEWSKDQEAYYIRLAIQLKPNFTEAQKQERLSREELAAKLGITLDKEGLLIPVKADEKGHQKQGEDIGKQGLKEKEQEIKDITHATERFGDSMLQAFNAGNDGAGAFLIALIKIAAEMLIIKGLRSALEVGDTATGGIFGFFKGLLSFSQSGIVPKQRAANSAIVSGERYSGDKTLVGVNAGEMILNYADQRELFRAIKQRTFSANNNSQILDVRVSGNLTAKKNKFAAEVTKAQTRNKKAFGVGSFGVYKK